MWNFLVLALFATVVQAINIGSDPRTWGPPKCTSCISVVEILHTNEIVITTVLLDACNKTKTPPQCEVLVSYAMNIIDKTPPKNICKLLSLC